SFSRSVALAPGHVVPRASSAGDAAPALFPFRGSARTAPTRRAVRCALEMQAAALEFQAVPTAAGAFTLAMRIGLGSGGALMAGGGDPATRLEHVLLGEAVGRAVAAERRAAQGQVVVDPLLRAG